MYSFNYHKPASLDQATQLLSDDEAKIIAGGMTLLPTMKQRLAQFEALVDIGAIKDLGGIQHQQDQIIIGATSTHSQVQNSPLVMQKIPALAELAGTIGDPQVRHRGTLGGSIANADPAADYPAAVVALNSTIHTNQRKISGDEFFTGLFETALEENEIITSVSFTIPERAAYEKFPNPASRYAMVGVMVAKHLDGQIKVAVTGAGDHAFRIAEMEQALSQSLTANSISGIEISSDGLNEDMHASSTYRAHLVKVMAGRAVARLD